jgi:hypothetical protein
VEELAQLLGREHVQLEFLLFKLLQVQHLLRSGDARFLRWSAEEIKRASRRVHDIEVLRSRRVHALGVQAGIPEAEISLTSLAEASCEPWRSICLDHGLGFARLQSEVDIAIRDAQRLAEASGHAIVDVLVELPRRAVPDVLPRQISLVNRLVIP